MSQACHTLARGRTCGTTALLAAAAAVFAAPAGALTASAVSSAGTLDSRAPAVAIARPAGGEVFHTAETETLRWTIDEQNWEGAAEPVTVRVYDDATLLDELTLSPAPVGEYALPWTVSDTVTDQARLVVAAVDRYGWAGADTSAVFEIRDGGTDSPPSPLADALGPAAPNPFNPSTTIAFSLAAAADIVLAVYDMRGREIARLAEGSWPAGRHDAAWDGRDGDGAPIASGAYLARLNIRDGGPSRPAGMVTRLTLVR